MSDAGAGTGSDDAEAASGSDGAGAASSDSSGAGEGTCSAGAGTDSGSSTDHRGWNAAIRNLLAVILLSIALLALARALPIWKIRLLGARISNRFPPEVVPTPVRVLPPPESEYLGVWERPPEAARATLLEEYGFKQMIRAYLHAYERNGQTQYEVASCAYRPDGFLGDWQLHVRLFPTAAGHTDVWCHWERNPNVAPIAHLRQDGYDPAEGKRQLQSMIEEPIT